MRRVRSSHPGITARLAWAVLAIVPTAFMGLFFLWPIGSLVARGLGESGTGGFLDVIGRESFWRVAWPPSCSYG